MKGKTSLIDGIYLGLQELHKSRHRNRALFVISDGGDNESVFQLRDLQNAYSSFPSPVFLLVPTFSLEDDSADPKLRDQIFGFASQTGGSAVPAANRNQFMTAALGIASAIRFPYTLCFPGGAVKTNRLPLKVETPGIRPRPLIFYMAVRKQFGNAPADSRVN